MTTALSSDDTRTDQAGDGPNSDDLLTIAEAAEILKVSAVTVSRWRRQGRLPTLKIGPRAVRIRRADLDQVSRPYSGPAAGLSDRPPDGPARPDRSCDDRTSEQADDHGNRRSDDGSSPAPPGNDPQTGGRASISTRPETTLASCGTSGRSAGNDGAGTERGRGDGHEGGTTTRRAPARTGLRSWSTPRSSPSGCSRKSSPIAPTRCCNRRWRMASRSGLRRRSIFDVADALYTHTIRDRLTVAEANTALSILNDLPLSSGLPDNYWPTVLAFAREHELRHIQGRSGNRAGRDDRWSGVDRAPGYVP